MVFIETTAGGTEFINPRNVTKCFALPSGDIRINMVDSSYTVTSMSWEDLEVLLG